MFRFLIKYLDLFKDDTFGTIPAMVEDPTGRVDYIFVGSQKTKNVHMFIEEVSKFAIDNNLCNYGYICDKQIDENSTDLEIFHMILALVRSDHFDDSALIDSLKDGTIIKYITILKDRYELKDKNK